MGAYKNVEFDGSLKMLIFPLKGKRGVLLAFLGAFSGAISQFYYLSFYFISSFFQPTLQHSFTFQVIPETLSHNTIGVQFLPVPGASSYIVQAAPRTIFSESGLQPSASLDEQVIFDTYITLRDLQPDTQYTIRISAVNDAGASEYNEVTENTKSMCFARAMDFERERVQVVCPAGCAKFQDNIYGTREYTDDSLICTAAVHDGRLGVEMGGEVTFVKRSGMPHYVGEYESLT